MKEKTSPAITTPSALPEFEKQIRFRINGVEKEARVEARLLLVHFVRDFLKLTGTHIGCDTTNCGACTIIVNGVSVKSCTLFAVQADGSDILTIEGLASPEGRLHPLQESFRKHHALQCGFCTPGMIMEAYWFLKQNPSPSEEEIRTGISGNLCRCTGYYSILEAIKEASKSLSDAKATPVSKH